MGAASLIPVSSSHVETLYTQALQRAVEVNLAKSPHVEEFQRLRVKSLAIPTQGDCQIHAFAAVPSDTRRLLFIHPGASHTWSQDAYWVTHFLLAGFAVVYFETYGHGLVASPFTARNPITSHCDAMTEAVLAAYRGGLIPLFEWQPGLASLPFHELGHSMGGGTLVKVHQDKGDIRIHTDAKHRTAIDSVVLVNPRLRLGSNYSTPLRSFAKWLARRLEKHPAFLEKLLQPLFRWPKLLPDIKPGNPEAARLLSLRKNGQRPISLPLAYGTTVFEHDEELVTALREHPRQLPRTLWALYPNDREVDPRTSASVALRVSGQDSRFTDVPMHNPWWCPGFDEIFPSIVDTFYDGDDVEEFFLLDEQSVDPLLSQPPQNYARFSTKANTWRY